MRRRSRRLLPATVVVGLAFQAPPVDYHTYRNARFGYSIPYPAALVRPQPEAPNGDGRRFVSADGATTLTVYGSHNALDHTAHQQLTMSRQSWQEKGATVTLAKVLPGGYVLSGTLHTSIFYEKASLQNGVFSTFIWQYPAAQKPRLDAVVSYTARTFRPGR
ncbi:hypothetical protein DLM85_13865 [Hymenobacter edaphi]|uniref:DUF1795 domain-containing protein n=1 Tax=Hymenobacter edaphi TaxID=2211146 RepID=A0A328BEF4_9BACT|nr:hypothetical protein DLM85_13865 [Hymenobacter edaphi]